MREPVRTEVDGVPTFWVDLPGPLRGALRFRVGEADETAPTHGVTHLVEHLALHGLHERAYQYNGTTELVRTGLFVRGQPDEVVEFFGTVCAALTRLPADRVETERRVLRAEAERRSASYRDTLLFWRYGAQGFGLAGLSELGLRWLDAPAVHRWAAERFTRQNAVLILTGPPPAGLRLPLPDGRPHPAPAPVPCEPTIPGWSTFSAAGIGLSGVVPRTPAAMLATQAVGDRLYRELRHERGLTYAVHTDYEPLGADTAHVVFSADADGERHGELRDGVLGVLDRLAGDGLDQEALDRLHTMRDRIDPDDLALQLLDGTASNLLLGRPLRSFEEMARQYDDVPVADVAAEVRRLRDSALFLLPRSLELPAPYRAIAVTSADAVTGQPYPALGTDETLLVGADGVSVVAGGEAITVRWADAAAALWWGDGTRLLYGRDGFQVMVAPWHWRDGAAAVAAIDRYAPSQVTVAMGDTGPAGPAPEPGPPPGVLDRVPAAVWWGLVGLAYAAGLLLLVWSTEAQGGEADPDGLRAGGLILIGLATAKTLALLNARRRPG